MTGFLSIPLHFARLANLASKFCMILTVPSQAALACSRLYDCRDLANQEKLRRNCVGAGERQSSGACKHCF